MGENEFKSTRIQQFYSSRNDDMLNKQIYKEVLTEEDKPGKFSSISTVCKKKFRDQKLQFPLD